MVFLDGRSANGLQYDSPLALSIPHFPTNSCVFKIFVLKPKQRSL